MLELGRGGGAYNQTVAPGHHQTTARPCPRDLKKELIPAKKKIAQLQQHDKVIIFV